MIPDKTGAAVLVEASPERKISKFMDMKNELGFLCSSNHFIINEAKDVVPVKHSLVRQEEMEKRLNSDLSKIDLYDVKSLLSEPYPKGLAFSYYQGGMGTLWSIIYEPKELNQYVCYGSPETGMWNLVNPNKIGYTETIIPLFDVKAPNDLCS